MSIVYRHLGQIRRHPPLIATADSVIVLPSPGVWPDEASPLWSSWEPTCRHAVREERPWTFREKPAERPKRPDPKRLMGRR